MDSPGQRIARKLWERMFAYEIKAHNPDEQPTADIAIKLMCFSWQEQTAALIDSELARERDAGQWTERELSVIDALGKKQELSRAAVLRQALRLYQLHIEGVPDVGDKAPPAEV